MSDAPMFRADVPTVARRQRPREVWIVAVMLMFFGGLSTALGVLLLDQLIAAASAPTRSVFGVALVWNLLAVTASLTHVLCGVFVLRGREWARKLAVGVCVLSVLSGLPLLVTGAVMAFTVTVLVYVAIFVNLNRRPVTDWTR